MKRSLALGVLAAGLVVAAACDSGARHIPTGPTFSVSYSIGPITHVSVCLFGASAGFNYNQPATSTAPAQSGTFNLADNECEVETNHADLTGPTDVTVTENVPAGFVVDSITAENTFTHAIVKVLNTNTITVRVSDDVGQVLRFYNHEVPQGVIGDFVWDDVNQNGVQDAGEPGIAGVPVSLGGDASATTTTDANGFYQFTGLCGGNYTVTVGTPAGYVATGANLGGDPARDSNGSPASVALAGCSSVDNTIDFGFYHAPTGAIGDFVWNDANENGIQDAGEAGIAGVTVTLGGAASATTTTDANGFYQFTGLGAGTYTVTVGTPAGFTPTPSNQGGDTNRDSNGSPATVTLPSYNSVDLSIDFGFIPMHVCTPVSNPSNFNGTAVAAGNTIWFNTIFKPKGVPAAGGVVNLTGSTIRMTSGGNVITVNVPDSRVTFSATATSASTVFNPILNRWEITVPRAYTGNIFLAGAAWVAPAGGLPGGANPVTWTGQMTTNMPGFSMNWQWAAAVYTSFGPLGSVGAKPIDGGTMNPYANSDHAGTPESFKSSVVGGARGGGGSNWTGSYSGTVAPPVCVY